MLFCAFVFVVVVVMFYLSTISLRRKIRTRRDIFSFQLQNSNCDNSGTLNQATLTWRRNKQKLILNCVNSSDTGIRGNQIYMYICIETRKRWGKNKLKQHMEANTWYSLFSLFRYLHISYRNLKTVTASTEWKNILSKRTSMSIRNINIT